MIAPRKSMKQDSVGAVLVIGGGIAGIQASLDLANSGQKVYLLERSPAIGGNMARLDKTFPTNDCSMCILSPKVVECGRHLNIETITWSDLEELSGAPGRYRVKLRRRARFVDADKCTGCGECVAVCPIEMPNEFDAAIGGRKAIFRSYPQAYPNTFVIDKKGRAPCRTGCPAGININGYVALTAMGKFDEALDVVLDTVPLPGVLGRVCDHPCEIECHLGTQCEPVAICAIKRFLADRRREAGGSSVRPRPENVPELERVAVIGAGPAGLAAARELVRKGYRPTIFEAMSRPGGMLAWGIPEYRLPRNVLDREIQDILDEGVELQLNTRLGRDVTLAQLRARGFAAVILAIGAQAGSKLGIDNEDAEGVVDSIRFLRDVNLGQPVSVGRKVVVVGGGNSAVDAARTALRLGAESVTILYRRTRAEMPAIAAEIAAADAEGIRLELLAAPVRAVIRDGRVNALECLRMKLGEPDASGRYAPIPIPGSEFTVETDMVISAVGQKTVLPEDPGIRELKIRRNGTIAADEQNTSTSLPGVYAIGDAVTGPRSVIEALGEGRRAAQAVDCFLRARPFEPLPRVTLDDVVEEPPGPEEQAGSYLPREQQRELEPAERIRSFAEVEGVFSEEQAKREATRCLHCSVCSECMACVKVCKALAIDHEQRAAVQDIEVGSIIVVPGFEEYQSELKYDFGYSRYPDVVSSIEFERILSASGPYGGHVQRPSDGREPKKIAFLQCVGSRDPSCRRGYCSSVCCMYAIKEAVIAKEHCKGLDVTIFFMDLRAFGKDFDKYYERAKSEHGVRFVRARVSDVGQQDGRLTVQYSGESGGIARDDFDMVVLSVGLQPAVGTGDLARKLGIRLDPEGFIWTDPANPLQTSRAGVFVGGPASEPKDIPETVVQAEGAACEAGALLASVRGTLTAEREFPGERDVSGEPPRIGVFVCHCGINIAGVVNVSDVAAYARTLPGVAFAENSLYTCSQDTQGHIREMINEHKLNRVVVASCSPRTHEPLFQQTLRESGLNPYLFEMANIRDQCSWIHMHMPAEATEKSKDLVRMAVAKAALVEPLRSAKLPVTHAALVIGGGLAGMTAALAIADQGFDVALVERDKELGGNLRRVRSTYTDPEVPLTLRELIGRVQRHRRIAVFTQAELKEIHGFVGNFESVVRAGGRDRKVKHGVVVVATGGAESKPTEYLYGRNKAVLTQLELEKRLARGGSPDGRKPVVMIQCVGSREPGHLYCSRVCCNTAVKNAIRIRRQSPETEVYILYRDIRTYGFNEAYYQQARDLGVTFIRYDLEHKPVVTNGRGLKVEFQDPLLGQSVVLRPGLLVLSSRVDISSGSSDLAKMLKVPQNEEGFFLEAHVKLRPVEFATEGVFVAGLAHSPKSMPETIAQAKAAAAKAATVLAKDEYEAEPTIAAVNDDLCDGCGICVPACEYNALEIVARPGGKEGEKLVRLNEAMCKGCGACVAACPSGAMEQKGFKNQQMLAMIRAALAE
jgi:heterodisulfide reductase subunit A-like polyferredoxin